MMQGKIVVWMERTSDNDEVVGLIAEALANAGCQVVDGKGNRWGTLSIGTSGIVIHSFPFVEPK